MSRESGLPTFRGKGGLWDTLNIEAVAARSSWYCGRRSDCNEPEAADARFFQSHSQLDYEERA